MDNLENTETLEIINVYDKADLKEQHELFRHRQHSFRDYIKIYSPYILCGILLILSLTTLFSLISFLDDTSTYKTALSACLSFINNSRFTLEGKYLASYLKENDPTILKLAHKKKFILQNCPTLLKKLHAKRTKSKYLQSFNVLTKSNEFTEKTRKSLQNKYIKSNDKSNKEEIINKLDVIVFNNLLVLKDFILKIIDFNKEDNDNSSIKTIVDSLINSTNKTNTEILKVMNLLLINNYDNIITKLKQKWLKMLSLEEDTDDENAKNKQIDYYITAFYNRSIKSIILKNMIPLLENYSKIKLHEDEKQVNVFKQLNLTFDDLQNTKDLIEYFSPILVSTNVEKNQINNTVNINSVFFAFQYLNIYLYKNLHSIFKFFNSLNCMESVINYIVQSKNTLITKLKNEALNIQPNKEFESFMDIKLANIKTKETDNEDNKVTKHINDLLNKTYNEVSLAELEGNQILNINKNLPNFIINIVSNYDISVSLLLGNSATIANSSNLIKEINTIKASSEFINDDVKEKFVKSTLQKLINNIINEKFKEFNFYNESDADLDNMIESLKTLNEQKFSNEEELENITLGNNHKTIFDKLKNSFLDLIGKNKDIWNDDK